MKFTTNPQYNSLFYDRLVKSYHNVFMFTEQLGFEPLTFKPLQGGDPEDGGIFGVYYVNGVPLARFRRHHLDPSLKESLFLQDFFLTDNRMHGTYEKIARDFGIHYVYNFKTAYGELVSMKGKIQESDIIDIFNKHGVIEIYNQYWEKNPKFSDYLTEFNNRKQILHDQGMDQFFEDMKINYPYLYNRFYLYFKNDAKNNYRLLMLLVKPPSSGAQDYIDFLAADYYFSQFPRLVNYFNHKPHIFKYWFGD